MSAKLSESGTKGHNSDSFREHEISGTKIYNTKQRWWGSKEKKPEIGNYI
jgi:hypothetical protein